MFDNSNDDIPDFKSNEWALSIALTAFDYEEWKANPVNPLTVERSAFHLRSGAELAAVTPETFLSAKLTAEQLIPGEHRHGWDAMQERAQYKCLPQRAYGSPDDCGAFEHASSDFDPAWWIATN